MIKDKLKRDIIKKISENQIKDLNSFFIYIEDYFQKTKYEPANINNTYGIYNTSINNGDMIYIAKDDENVLMYLKKFIILWNQLEKLDLITSVPFDEKLIPIVSSRSTKKNIKPIDHLFLISKDYINKIIVADVDNLQKFISHKFLSDEEMNYRKEHTSRIIAQIFTFILVVTALIQSLRSCNIEQKENLSIKDNNKNPKSELINSINNHSR